MSLRTSAHAGVAAPPDIPGALKNKGIATAVCALPRNDTRFYLSPQIRPTAAFSDTCKGEFPLAGIEKTNDTA